MTVTCLFCILCFAFWHVAQARAPPRTRLEERRKELNYFLDNVTAENQYDYLANAVTPYWNLTYEDQLQIKQKRCEDIISNIEKRARTLRSPFECRLKKIVPSPVITSYRNKDEFTIRHGIDGNPKTVGFLVGKLSLGRAYCVSPKHVCTIKESHKKVAQVYEDFIRSHSAPACLELHDGGHWRTLLVRSNDAGDVMVSVTVHPSGYTEDDIMQHQTALKEYFMQHLPNVTLFHQVCPHTRCTHNIAPFTLLYGNPYLMETLKDYQFKISPDTFFQVNKKGAEVLYNTAIKMARLNSNSTLLDLCCGSGIISILASKQMRGAIGIEAVPQSVIDARDIAESNNITNVEFVRGRVEKKLGLVMSHLNHAHDIVAIMNPGRAGLGLDVIRTIRKAMQIRKLVYISCKPDSHSTVQNFVHLCSHTTSTYPPFRLTKAVPVDLFPQTEHIELILSFER